MKNLFDLIAQLSTCTVSLKGGETDVQQLQKHLEAFRQALSSVEERLKVESWNFTITIDWFEIPNLIHVCNIKNQNLKHMY